MLNKIDERIANPTASIWISASAGTGKTKSLIDRILALLFNGVQPNKILCLTYTNAAADEMQERLQKIITNLYEQKEIKHPQFPQLSQEVITKLYKQSLSTEWVSIQTIHSYCLSVLRKFSIESGLLPNVKLSNDFQRNQLISNAINAVINDSQFHNDFKIIAKYLNDFSNLVNEIDLSKISDFLTHNHQLFDLYADIFNLDNEDLRLYEEQFILKTLKLIGIEDYKNTFENLANRLNKGSKRSQQNADFLKTQTENLTTDWVFAFLTRKGEIKSDSFLCPGCDDYTYQESKTLAEKASNFMSKLLDFEAAKCNIAFFNIMRGVFDNFRREKNKNHCIDFDDAIDEATLLLKQFDWICYKIDNAVEHVLVDEAQDTSPKQWEVIRLITNEFFTNYQSTKTIFIVGDEKQSIFSFQGADVAYFQKMHDFFKNSVEQCGQKFFDIQLNKSYRTTGGILKFVDSVFSNMPNFSKTEHDTARDKIQGFVKIENLIESQNDEDNENEDYSTESQIKLAKQISNIISDAIKNHLWIPSKNRAAQPSDFLILFQTRKLYTIKTICNILKSNDIDVCEPDQIDLNDELVIQDLLSLAEFCLLPSNNLACAQVLTSPVVGMSDKELEQLCLNREEYSLWNYAQSVDLFAKYQLEDLQKYIEKIDYSPYSFFTSILNDGNFEKFERRLGNNIHDVINNFLEQAEWYENNHTPILQNFVNWFKTTDMKTKRDFDTQNGVKIMTAHKSKGLQAPIVIIADSHYDYSKSAQKEHILQDDSNRLFWKFSSLTFEDKRAKKLQKLYEQQKIKNAEESHRLLYVAMTRAEDFLFFCGIKPNKNSKDDALTKDCWYSLVNPIYDEKDFILPQHIDNITEIPSQIYTAPQIPHWYFEKTEPPQEIQNEKSEEITYGNCVHDILDKLNSQSLSQINFENIYEMTEQQFQKAKDEAVSVYTNFHEFFGKNTLSEVELVYNKQLLRIDKIALKNNTLLILDFKTGDRDAEKVQKYTKQLKLYEQAIISTQKFSDYTISKALLWTKTMHLEEIH